MIRMGGGGKCRAKLVRHQFLADHVPHPSPACQLRSPPVNAVV
jgi:hypothetical protein